MLIVLSACVNDKIFESYTTLPENEWQEDKVQKFEFEIEESQNAFDLYFTIKNSLDFPFHNIYVDYQLVRKDGENETVIKSDLKEYILFDPKTGQPFGSGSSGWYDHEFTLNSNYRFEQPGLYEVRLQQYMRREALQGVATVGFALAVFDPDN